MLRFISHQVSCMKRNYISIQNIILHFRNKHNHLDSFSKVFYSDDIVVVVFVQVWKMYHQGIESLSMFSNLVIKCILVQNTLYRTYGKKSSRLFSLCDPSYISGFIKTIILGRPEHIIRQYNSWGFNILPRYYMERVTDQIEFSKSMCLS